MDDGTKKRTDRLCLCLFLELSESGPCLVVSSRGSLTPPQKTQVERRLSGNCGCSRKRIDAPFDATQADVRRADAEEADDVVGVQVRRFLALFHATFVIALETEGHAGLAIHIGV